MKAEIKIVVDMDKAAELADRVIDPGGFAEQISDAAIHAMKSQVGRMAGVVDSVLEKRFGDYATVDVTVVE